MTAAPRVRALSVHADYRCRSTGVCCSSGWPIPVEPAVEEGLRAALQSGVLEPASPGESLRRVDGLPHGARVVLGGDVAGRCLFLERTKLCAVHRRLGEEALPSACRHFPRVATLTPVGVSVTLSHWCPTAAGMLFRDDVDLAVVEEPAAFPASWPWEGLDARDALPPFLRPGVLMDWPSLERWERFAVRVLGEEGRTPEAALRVLEGAAERAREWTPGDGGFGEFFEVVLARGDEGRGPAFRGGALRNGNNGCQDAPDPAGQGSGACVESRTGLAWTFVARAVPHCERLPPAPQGLAEAEARWVEPAWASLSRPVRRWLAAKAFASWLALQGEGLRTAVLGLRVGLGVLRAEAARGCAEAGRDLDADLLKEAVRRADLLLVHLADPDATARRLSRCEAGGSLLVAW